MVTVSALVKNEVDRWLPDCLDVWQRFADCIAILDDASTDDLEGLVNEKTTDECPTYVETMDVGLYRNRTRARKAAWNHARRHTPSDGWIFVLDADMIPAADPTPYFKGERVAFKTLDLWDSTHYRDDVFWQQPWRTWAVRNGTREAEWTDDDIHTAHLPDNYATGYAQPCPVPLLHYAYSTPASRLRQYEKYMANADLLTPKEFAHARTILHPTPHTVEVDAEWLL